MAEFTDRSMNDADGPMLAREVYAALLENSKAIDADQIPYALDRAVRKMREAGFHRSRWATYMHMGV